PAPILHTLVKARARAQLLFLGGIGKELVLNEEFQEDAPLGAVRQAAEIAANFSLGEPHVCFRNGLTVNPGHRGLLGPHRQPPKGHQREDASRYPAMCHSHVITSNSAGIFLVQNTPMHSRAVAQLKVTFASCASCGPKGAAITSLTRDLGLLIWNRPGGTGYSQALLRAGSCFPCCEKTPAKPGARSGFCNGGQPVLLAA